ncbi:MAG: hypothetical protein DRJ43_07255 [Thermoprotei archaeon]|nr:MAG: hypothetical protein DRJ43_07255 [Thermoprotei archaeon]
MMRRLVSSAFLSILILALLCPRACSVETVRVPAGGYRYGYFTDLDEGDTIKVWFRVIDGPDITVFICDAENFARYARGERALVYELHEDYIEGSISFSVPYGGDLVCSL